MRALLIKELKKIGFDDAFADFGDAHLLAATLEQGDPQLVFQRGNAAGDCGDGDAALLRRRA